MSLYKATITVHERLHVKPEELSDWIHTKLVEKGCTLLTTPIFIGANDKGFQYSFEIEMP